MLLSILVIDDEPGICTLLKEILVRQGYQVYEARDGTTGLEQFYRMQPDLVLLDVNMPGRDGIAVLKEIRRQNTVAGVLMVSAFKQTQLIATALDNGADGYLQKPFRLTDLLKEVQRVGAAVRLRRTMLITQSNWQNSCFSYEPLLA
jgi:DNA-binding response OmpR family regulator